MADTNDSVPPFVSSYEWVDANTLELHFPQSRLRLAFLKAGVVRCRYITGCVFERIPSYGRSPDYRSQLPKIHEVETPEYFELRTSRLHLRIRKSDGGLEFYDAEAPLSPLCADAEGMGHRPQERTGDQLVWVLKQMPPEAQFYGLGDKPCALNMRGRRLEMWGSDCYKFTADSDPLYKSIPFFLCLTEGRQFGLFFDNSMRSYFDFGAEREDRLLFGADGGVMDYYFICGDSPLNSVQEYTQLTGLPPMPPLWSLGYHQSKWSYKSAAELQEIAAEMRRRNLPCDALHLDIEHLNDYQALTWNREHFSDPAGMIADLAEQGFKCVSIVNPGIKINPDNYVWRSGFEKNVFCRRHDGALLEGEVWPGNCTFPDFTSPKTRHWWAGLFEREIAQYGIRGMWTDMNEPVLFPDKTFPDDTRHNYDGFYCSHLKAHNVYGQCMAAATRVGMERFAPARRPFVLSRAGFAGLQRLAATWTGDNASDWTHLRLANTMVQRLSTSGVSFCGADTGGFLGHPSGELFARWMQLSAFHLFMRNHNNGNDGAQEPWCFGPEVESQVRDALEQRYRLLPYIYTQFYRYTALGLPIIRTPMLMEPAAGSRERAFFFGDAFYVVPVERAGVSAARHYLPRGHWYSLWDDSPAPAAGQRARVPIEPHRIPVYVRAGHVIPRWPVQQFVGELAHPAYELDLWWAPNTAEHSLLYRDDGEGHGYRLGQYLLHEFDYLSGTNHFSLCRNESGGLNHKQSEIRLRVHALPADIHLRLCVNGEEVAPGMRDETGVLHLTLPTYFSLLEFRF